MKDLSKLTRLYIFSTWAVGLILLFWNLPALRFDSSSLIEFLVLIATASFSQIYKVEGTTNRSHYAVSFTFYAFSMMLLGVPATLIIILLSNVAEWLKNRSLWYTSFFNIAVYIVSIGASHITYTLINPGGGLQSWMTVLAILAGMVVFTLLNHFLVGVVVWLARGQNLGVSGIFDFLPLMVDLTMLIIGASLFIVWNFNPYAISLFIIPLYMIYSTLRVPALERKVELDAKTGIYNHEYFMQQFQDELPRANRFDRPLTVIMADLDLLRNINNTYGHLAGDEVIKGVARLIQLSVREYDVVARFGGEEFGILLPETKLDVGYERAETIRKAVEKAEFVIPTSSTPIKVTISLGVAARDHGLQSREEILHNADTALFRSKLNGRNCTYAYSESAYTGMNQIKQDDIAAGESQKSDVDANSSYRAAFTTFHSTEPNRQGQAGEDDPKSTQA